MSVVFSVGVLSNCQLSPQGPMLDGQVPVEARHAEEGPGPGTFRAELGDSLQRPGAQQQPSRPDWVVGE